MLEVFAFLLSLGNTIKNIFDELKSSERRKLAKRIHQFHIQLQIIIDSAERIFNLIETADEQIEEYGKLRFNRIIQDNFSYQFNRIIDLVEKLREPDMSLVFEKLDDDLKEKLRSILFFKMDSIRHAMLRLANSKLKIEDNELYIGHGKKKTPAFPEINEQIKTLKKLKRCSRSLGRDIYSVVDLKDLL